MRAGRTCRTHLAPSQSLRRQSQGENTRNSFIDIAKAFAAINIIAAMYFHYRYTVGPSSTQNFRSAQFHWVLSGLFVALAALTDNSPSTITTTVLVLVALIAPIVPIAYLRKTRTERTPTFLDEIATDDIIDRAHNTRDQD